jgi:hypothetical protein
LDFKNGMGEKIYRDPIDQESTKSMSGNLNRNKKVAEGKFIATQFHTTPFFKNIN